MAAAYTGPECPVIGRAGIRYVHASACTPSAPGHGNAPPAPLPGAPRLLPGWLKAPNHLFVPAWRSI